MIKGYLQDYYQMAAERSKLGIDPLALSVEQTKTLCELFKSPPLEGHDELLHLMRNRVLAGVDESAKIKAEFLAQIAQGELFSPLLKPQEAIKFLGLMKGGYNVMPLIKLLKSEHAALARAELAHTLLIYDAFDEVAKYAQEGVSEAQGLIEDWAEAKWFNSNAALPPSLKLTVFKVTGEQNTDDLSPATDAWSRPDIPLHALAMFKNSRDGLKADVEGVKGPISLIEELKLKGNDLIYVGDVVGTGSSRKSATNSLLWHMGKDIDGVPNKRAGGFVLGGKIAPIFYNTLEDSGALPIEMDVSNFEMGDEIELRVYDNVIIKNGQKYAFKLKTKTLLDEVRAGGRIPLIIGRDLTSRARNYLGLGASEVFVANESAAPSNKGYTRAQKIVGKACGREGVRPGEYVEVKVTTVGSQDTTGPMTRDELKDLACLKFLSPLVMQSFCHTAAYPKAVDINTQETLPKFIENRGGVALHVGDGVIHSWLNRMTLPDTVGTGGDSHTRFPIGISFAAGSGLVAFAAATGMMPLDMPESVLVRFKGKLQQDKGITLRDLVHAIPYYAIKQGLLTVEKKNKKNIFSGRILEIEGLEHLDVEHAFELADASAERSAAACAIKLNQDKVNEYLASNAVLLRKMAESGYADKDALLNRAAAMEEFVKNGSLIEADADCEYAAVIEIDMDEITEPILCVPNDPDDVHLLSEYEGTKIDEVFIGSCMTNIGHYRAASIIFNQEDGEVPVRLWLAPPTRLDKDHLTHEGVYSIFGKAGARIEMPGCSLCMGNQARVADGATVVSTSTRNFPNRLGKGANVFLSSAEVAAVSAKLARLPSVDEYRKLVKILEGKEDSVYKLMDFTVDEVKL